jgi:hypothetical protein
MILSCRLALAKLIVHNQTVFYVTVKHTYPHSIHSSHNTKRHLPEPSNEPGKDVDLLPCSLTIIDCIQRMSRPKPFEALFNGGSDTTFIHKGCLPPGAMPRLIKGRSGQSLASLLHTNQMVELEELILPEISHSSHVDFQPPFVL